MEQTPDLLSAVDLSKDIPAVCAEKLKNDEVDLGLVPVAIIPKLKQAHIVSNYCIGAFGKVSSVLLVSQVPLDRIKKIYLDYQSRTSVQLCQVLCNEHWKIQPEFIQAQEGYEEQIKEEVAGVIIGDRTFHIKNKYSYTFDLSEAWFQLTSLPFVFATWVSNKPLSDSFLQVFNQSLEWGIKHIPEAIDAKNVLSIDRSIQLDYLTNSIQYRLEKDYQSGLNLFLKYLQA